MELWNRAKLLVASSSSTSTGSFFATTVRQLQESLQECQQFSNDVGMACKYGSVPPREVMHFQQKGARSLGDLADKAKALKALMSGMAQKEPST